MPIKPITMPKLELTALTLAARLGKFVVETFAEEIQFESIHIWSDSQIALSWVQNDKKLPSKYVYNRVNEIKKLQPEAYYHYVKTDQNPADMVSRGVSVSQLRMSSLWWHGPPCLLDRPSRNFVCQPPVVLTEVSSNETLCERIDTEIPYEPIDTHVHQSGTNFPVDLKRIGTYKKLVNVLLFVLKFMKIRCSKQENLIVFDEILVREQATNIILRHCQSVGFPEICSYFLEGGKVPNLVNQLNLIYVNGLIRCKGRMEFSNMEYDAKFPILLPRGHHVTNLIIEDIHNTRFHCGGVNDVMAALREKFWVPQARQTIKSILHKCVTCRRHQGKPFPAPKHAPLPAERISESRPFSVCGLDYSGYLSVKTYQNEVTKVYIALFTCAVTRAIHLEIVENGSEAEFLCAFRRFVSRRSYPSLIISDNDSTYIAADKTLKGIAESSRVSEFMNSKSISWKFITKRSPWMGGFYERMIGLTKNCLRKVLGSTLITLSDLRTIIVEIEGGLNDRPLTYVSNDIDNLSALTPSHLIMGHRLDSFPDITLLEDFNDASFGERELIDTRSRHISGKLNQFWRRWRSEYLLALREKHNNFVSKDKQLFKEGDIVLIHADLLPRARWKLGVITELYRSSDNLVRSVKLRTAKGETTRPICKLYPLEVHADMGHAAKLPSTLEPPVSRPRRAAAQRAIDAMRSE